MTRNIQLFSTDTDDGTISVVTKTGRGEHRRVEQIRVGNAPRGGVKFTQDGRGFVSNTSQNTVSEIDAVSLTEVRRIEVGHGPRGLGILPGDRYLLVSNSGSDTVSVVDLEVNVQIHEIPVGRDPRHMGVTADGRTAYVCVWGAGHVAKLDLTALTERQDAAGITEAARIPVDPTAHPYSLALTPCGRRVFVANTQAPYVTVIDTATDQVHRVDLGFIGGRAIAFSPDGRYAMVTVETVSRLYVIDIDTLEVTRHIPVAAGPRGLVVDASDQTAYVTNFSRATVMSVTPELDYDPNTLTVIDLSSAPLDRDEGTFDAEPLYVGYGPCSVTMFDLDTLPAEERQRRVAHVDA